MDVYCTRSDCPRPQNHFADLDDTAILKTVQQKYCTSCGMPLILVGRYIPQKLLGKGGFGAAFLARDRYTPGMRKCVVKQFKPAGDLTPSQLDTAQKLFEREAEVLEQIGNQNNQIPDLFAYFEITVPGFQRSNDQFFYLVQEFIDGRNLEEELQEKGKFSEAEVTEVLQEVLKVLQFVHDSGSIHRDIKPSNIMRHRNGRLYLLDFGAVKQVASTAKTSGSSTGIYSMGFAPPEQMSGGQVYPSTDLYALAVTCLILLTGKEAMELFDGYSNQWNWRSHAQVSARLANVLDKMLLAAPNQRFGSAQEVLAALNTSSPPATPSHPLTTTPPSNPTPTPPPVRQAPPAPPPVRQKPRARFSTLELLFNGAFSGFEGGLIAIALASFLGTTLVSTGAWLLILAVLVFAQWRRWIEKWDLIIIAGITLAAVLFVPGLTPKVGSLLGIDPRLVVLTVAALAALVAIAVTAIFRLIYKLLSLIL